MRLLVPLAIAGCGDFRDCETVDTAGVAALPARLSETGWSEELVPFEPRFALWSDGAEKRRWILLPEGEQVDTSRPESWDFPVGTRLFKEFRSPEGEDQEFARGGVRIETRMIERLESGWTGVAYLWEADGSDAVAVPQGRPDALGTSHDVPDAVACVACHGGRESFVLGFSAVQLDDPALDVLLTDPVPVDLPGDTLDQAALGYLHANCSHCHNPERDLGQGRHRCYDPPGPLDFTLPPTLGSVGAAPVLQTPGYLGHGDHSLVLQRMSERNDSRMAPSMPPLGTEKVDQEAIALLTEWIGRL